MDKITELEYYIKRKNAMYAFRTLYYILHNMRIDKEDLYKINDIIHSDEKVYRTMQSIYRVTKEKNNV